MIKLSYAFTIVSFFLMMVLLNSCKEDPVSVEAFGSISGQVFDSESGGSISNVNITTNPGNSIVTGNDGKFSLENVAVGSYNISANKSGYQRTTVIISVRENETTPAAVFMEKDAANNTAPNPPENPSPGHAARNQQRSFILSWSASDPDAGDSLLYDVLLYESNSPVQRTLVTDHPDASAAVTGLNFGTTYFWQVIAKDSSGAGTNGTVWSFSTEPLPDLPLLFASRGDGNYNIFSFRLTGDDSDPGASDTLQLTSATSRDWWPRMSPNRDKIAFVSDRDIEAQIYTINRNGTDLFKVTIWQSPDFIIPVLDFPGRRTAPNYYTAIMKNYIKLMPIAVI